MMFLPRALLLLLPVPFFAHGFAVLPIHQQLHKWPANPVQHASSGDDNSIVTDDAMEALISKLSSTSDDTDRREQLSSLLHEGMMEDTSFASRFETSLMQRGEMVQTQARQDVSNEEGKKELWALVDMMVQSKVIIKKFNESKE